MSCKKKLKKFIDSKNQSYASIAKYLYENNDIHNLKIKDLEKHCHVSPATVIRFCKEMELSGFSELKFLLSKDNEEEEKSEILKNYALTSMTNKHLDEITNSFINTREFISDEQLKRTVSYIENAKQINIFAIGNTYIIAKDLEMKMERINKYCKAYNDINLQYFAAKNSSADSLNIGISYSGKTANVINNLLLSKEEGATTILITSKENTKFNAVFDQVFFISAEETGDRLVTTTSRLAALYVVDLIYNSYLNMDKDKNNKILKNTRLP